MKIKPITTFSCFHEAIIRNQNFDKAFLPVLLLTDFFSIFFSLSYFFLFVIYGILRFFNYKKEFSTKEKVIFNTVDVFDDTLVFRTSGENKKYIERISFHNIDKIVIRQIKKDDLSDTGLVLAFEFQHRYGQKPLLRYDIIGRERFEEILIQKGIKIVSVPSVEKSCITK